MSRIPNLDQTLPGANADLRRRRQADFARKIVERSEHLEPHDRQLILAVYSQGQTIRDVAVLLSVSYRRVRLRCKALVSRMQNPAFGYVAYQRDHWNPTMKAIATRIVLHGRSLNQTASELKLSYHTVRRQRDLILAMASGAADHAKVITTPRMGKPVRAREVA